MTSLERRGPKSFPEQGGEIFEKMSEGHEERYATLGAVVQVLLASNVMYDLVYAAPLLACPEAMDRSGSASSKIRRKPYLY